MHANSELSQFPGVVLSATFREQTEKWESLVLAHVSRSIGLVHDYIFKLLNHICPDRQVREQLWQTVLVDGLRKAYIRAMSQARFLLQIERHGYPSTYNHYFNAEVQKKRHDRLKNATGEETDDNKNSLRAALMAGVQNLVINKNNAQHVREDIFDVLASYYEVSRERFVDVICRQVISHFLLEGDESPLKIFSSELVMGLDDAQLEMIAGEDAETRSRRAVLQADIQTLEAAMKVLRA